MGLIAISSLMLLGGMYLMIAFAWWLLQIIANWRIFIKAGEDGWKSIIPIYGDYISYKIAWQPAYFWLTLVLGIVSSCLQGTLETNDSLMISMSIVLIKIILAIISIMYSVKLARAFGRGTGFAIGLIFLLASTFYTLSSFSSNQNGQDSHLQESCPFFHLFTYS